MKLIGQEFDDNRQSTISEGHVGRQKQPGSVLMPSNVLFLFQNRTEVHSLLGELWTLFLSGLEIDAHLEYYRFVICHAGKCIDFETGILFTFIYFLG